MKKTKNILAVTMLSGAMALQGPVVEAQDGPNAIRPFKVHFSDTDLKNLRQRILATKWPKKETVNDGSQGVQFATMQKLATYWATNYDWRKVEAKLNALPQFITNIDGLDIHFIHVGRNIPMHCR